MTRPDRTDDPGGRDDPAGQDDPWSAPQTLGRLLLPVLLVLAVAAMTPTDELWPDQGDLLLYVEVARSFAGGSVPYLDFPFEYPTGALVPMVAPYLAWPFGEVTLDRYKWLFAGWNGLLMVGLGVIVARIVRLGGDAEVDAGRATADRLRRTGTRLVILSACAALAITWRFDLYPTLLMMVGLWAALERRAGAAGVAVGLGVLGKLFPAAILPAMAIPWLVPFDPRGLLRLGVAAGATVAAGIVPFLVLAGPEPTLQFLRYNADRGLQIETIGGGLASLLGMVNGTPIDVDFGFRSISATGAFAEAWLALLPIATVAGFGLIAWIGWRRVREEAAAEGEPRPSTIVSLATVSILMLLVTAKVYSIQYVVWFVPLVALLAGRQFWLAAAVAALTMPIHPFLYRDLVVQQWPGILVLNLRNALLVALLGWLLWKLARPARLELTTFRSAT